MIGVHSGCRWRAASPVPGPRIRQLREIGTTGIGHDLPAGIRESNFNSAAVRTNEEHAPVAESAATAPRTCRSVSLHCGRLAIAFHRMVAICAHMPGTYISSIDDI